MAKKLLYQALSFVPVIAPVGTADVLFAQSNDLVPHQRVTLYQSIAEPVPIVSATPTVNVDSWFAPLSQPQAVRKLPTADQQFTAFVRIDKGELGWLNRLSEPVRFTRRQDVPFSFVPVVAPPAPGSGNVLFAQTATTLVQQKTLLYQSVFAPVPIVSSETITADKWFRPLSEPQWRKPKPESGPTYVPRLPTDVTNGWLVPLSTPTLRTGLPAKEQQSLAFVPTVAGASPGSGDVLFAQAQTTVIHQKTLLYQSVFAPTAIVSTETVTVDKWFAQLSIPPDGGFGSADLSGTFFAVEPSFAWYRPLAEPTRRKPSVAHIQASAFVPVVAAPETITLDKWYRPLAEPSRRKATLQVQQPAFVTFKIPEYFYPPLSEPLRRQSRLEGVTALVQVVASSEVITPDKWLVPLSEPSRAKKSVQQQELAFVKADPFPESVTADRWAQPFSTPPKKLAFPASEQQAAAFVSVVAQAEIITVDKWYQPLSTPTLRKGLSVSEQQALTLGPLPITASLNGWWSPLAEPVRGQAKRDAQQPVFVGIVTPETITVDKWYRDFDVPTRRISYKATLAPYYFASNYLVPAPYVDPPMASWSYSWSMPVRVRTSIMTAAQASGVIPVIPQPNPPPAPGVYTVSGLYVTDQFTDNTVVYNYGGGVSHRTN